MNFSPARIVAAGWALIFAGLHAIWAVGLPIGLPQESAWPFTSRPEGYDIGVAIGSLIAVLIALWGHRLLVILVGLVPLIRGLVGIAELIVRVTTHGAEITGSVWVEPWLVVGGVLFLIAARRRRRIDSDVSVAAGRS